LSRIQALIEGALGLMPAPVHRAALRRLFALRKRWWRLTRPDVYGCRVLALDDAGRVLLVRHSYGPTVWMTPGGGLTAGEDPLLGAAREFSEELGCGLTKVRLVVRELELLHGAGNHVHVVLGQCDGTPVPDMREITHAQFFAIEALPDDLGNGLADMLPRWMGVTAP
jgi:8-oxo-dGTP pyrophosphatase MutT (NUDIX family)